MFNIRSEVLTLTGDSRRLNNILSWVVTSCSFVGG